MSAAFIASTLLMAVVAGAVAGAIVVFERRRNPFPVRAVRILTLKPDDIVVLRTSQHLSLHVLERLREHLRRAYTDNKVMILDGGLEIDVVRPAPKGDGT